MLLHLLEILLHLDLGLGLEGGRGHHLPHDLHQPSSLGGAEQVERRPLARLNAVSSDTELRLEFNRLVHLRSKAFQRDKTRHHLNARTCFAIALWI